MKKFNKTFKMTIGIGILCIALLTPTTLIFAQSQYTALWSEATELQSVPMSGLAWTEVLNAANAVDPSLATIENQDSNNNADILAAAIVYARTGTQSYKDKVVTACSTLVADESPPGDGTLAWARELGAYALAADLVDYRTTEFETWLLNVAEVWVAPLDSRKLLNMYYLRPNNWGTQAFGSLVAVYAYLGNTVRLLEVVNHWKAAVDGPNPGQDYGTDLSWHVDENDLRILNPAGAVKNGLNIDGIYPDDMRRNGSFSNPPPTPVSDYHWDVQQGPVMAARILDRIGMPLWSHGDSAFYRSVHTLEDVWATEFGSQWKADGDDAWMLPFVDEAYDTDWTSTTADPDRVWEHGKNTGWGYVTLSGGTGTDYRLDVIIYGSGSVTLDPPGGLYADETVVTLTANPDAGNYFDIWMGDLTGSDNPETILMDSYKTVTARFLPDGVSMVDLNPTDDSYINSETGYKDVNYDSDTKLAVKDAAAVKEDLRAILKFDMTGLSGTVTEAILKLYCEALPDGSPVSTGIFPISVDSWDETTVTWNNAPAEGIQLVSEPNVTAAGVVYEFDITSFVASEMGGNKIVSVFARGHMSKKKTIHYGNREGSHPPFLTVTLDGGGGTTTTTTTTTTGGGTTTTTTTTTTTIATTTTTTTAGGPSDDVANSDIPVSGTVTGSYTNTQSSNDVYESIEEIESGGKPSNRYTYLEHKWTIDVTGGTSVTFYVEAYHTSNSEGDDFVFAYSTNDADYTDMVTVTKTSDDDACQSYALPGSTSGTVYIRVKDTDQTSGNRNKDIIYVDHMYIHSGISKDIAYDNYPVEVIVPSEFTLNNYPNPFNPSTTIEYSLPEAGHVVLTIYDIHGRMVTELFNGYHEAGVYSVIWDAVSDDIGHTTSGIYFLNVRSSRFNKTVKMMLLK